jgi:hypothetical protein
VTDRPAGPASGRPRAGPARGVLHLHGSAGHPDPARPAWSQSAAYVLQVHAPGGAYLGALTMRANHAVALAYWLAEHDVPYTTSGTWPAGDPKEEAESGDHDQDHPPHGRTGPG